jgi:type IX secretion system PorP/SprF family membrane protein
MKWSRFILAAGLVCLLKTLVGQDIHYTLFNMAPLTLNPALAGAYEGTARIGGIYRNQWFTVTDMSTPTFYIDAPVVRGFRKQDWVGVGLNMFQDQAGTQRLITSGGLFTAAYHFSLDKTSDNVLTLGGQYGQVQRRIDYRTIRSEGNNFDPSRNDTDFPLDADRSGNYADINVGLLFRSKVSDEMSFELGARMLHIASREYSSFAAGGAQQKREPNFGFHGLVNYRLNEKWSAEPTFMWQTTQGGGNEISVQAWGVHDFKEDIDLRMGLAYRVKDSAKFLFGVDYKDFRAALAYDLNISSANPITNYQGGFEIAAYYIIKIYKKPTLQPAILCPRL